MFGSRKNLYLTEKNFYLTKNTATIINIPENDNILYNLIILHNLDDIQRLFINSLHNVYSIEIANNNDKKTVILNNLPNVILMELENSNVTVILGDELPSLKQLRRINSSSSEIIDNNKILNCLNIKDEEEFSFDERFSNVKNLAIFNGNLRLPLKSYSNLEALHLDNVTGKFEDIKFRNLKEFYLHVNNNIEFNNCNFDSVEILCLFINKHVKVKEIYINSIFSNLKKISVSSCSKLLKRINLRISDNNPDIVNFKMDNNIEIYGDLAKHLSENIKKDYKIISPKRKNPNSVY